MKVLVIGSGGREHALCWKLAQSPELEKLYCAPGNHGIGRHAELVPIGGDEVQRLADFAAEMKMDLTVIGPELPLTLGLADELRRRGLAVFGPGRTGAELEGSKVFAKEFMQRYRIPTARFRIASDGREAAAAAAEFGFPVVLKADGLAAGKGVIIPQNSDELGRALAIFFDERRFGASASRLVVEEYLAGEEISLIALSDGNRLLPMATSKDYKRIGEGDTGPNTGGMGSHSPSAVITSAAAVEVLDRIMRPVIAGLAEEERAFIGVLYAGLVLTSDGPKVLEFNVRFGDPEVQSILLRLESDLLPVLAAAAAGDFGEQSLRFRKEAAACIVLASADYPGTPVKGEVIQGLDAAGENSDVVVFHAATSGENGRVLSAGGRVLDVCATGTSLREALSRAYLAADQITWPSKRFRSDIGRRVVAAAG